MFQSAALKLTIWYLAIIMLISIVFSVGLYRVSSDDLDRNINKQVSYYNGFLSPFDLNNYSQIRERQLNQDRNHLKANLIALNVIVLALGGLVSYALARRTLEPIEESLEAQKRFAADASHELRTPLAAMQSETEVALRDPKISKAEALNLLKSNLEEVAKLRDLSDGLLRLANQNGKPGSTHDVDLPVAAKTAIERLSKAAESKNIKITEKYAAAKVHGDKQTLIDLAAILLDNAIKYSPSGNEVIVSTGQHGKHGILRVEDHGQGIAAVDLPRIFERFYRADTSRNKDQADGYGLGLALARKIAEAHDGHIEVKSTVGIGSTFTVYLPAS